MFKKQLTETLEKILNKKYDLDSAEIEIEIPADLSKGDYSTNIALKLSKKLGRNPMDIAKNIAEGLLGEHGIDAEAKAPGFINIKINHKLLSTLLQGLITDNKEVELAGKTHHGRKVVVEYTDPNPFKEFHIGHLYSNSVGESISRLLEDSGAEVFRVCYQGDVGVHVAKAIFGMVKSSDEMPKDSDNLSKKAKFLGKAYVLGAKAYEEDESAAKEIDEINKKVYNKDSEITALWEKGRRWSLEYFDLLYRKLGTHFDKLYFESEAGEEGLKIVKENTPKVFKKDQGAIIFRGEDHGLHTRVFVNSAGLPTYEAKELGLAPLKYKDFPYDLSIIITGNEINEYFKVLLKALSLIEPELAEKTLHISHGMVRLASGKISSRTGDVVTAEQILEEVEKKIKEEFKDVSLEKLSLISVGAVKYGLLKSSLGRDIIFNIDESISLNGNSGPYIQYTYARTQSVLGKSEIKNKISNLKLGSLNLDKEEEILLRKLVHFGDFAEIAASNFSPNTICTYLFELSQNFNLFYEKRKILESEKEEFRLSLTFATGKILKKGLYLLGIEAPERM